MKPLQDIGSSNTSKPTDATASIAGAGTASDKSNSKLHVQLKKLNMSVLQWMQQHVAKDPYCILTPIFKDYEKYLKTIQDEFKPKSDTKDTGSIPAAFTEQETSLGKNALVSLSSPAPLHPPTALVSFCLTIHSLPLPSHYILLIQSWSQPSKFLSTQIFLHPFPLTLSLFPFLCS